jgi:hypothetical protein
MATPTPATSCSTRPAAPAPPPQRRRTMGPTAGSRSTPRGVALALARAIPHHGRHRDDYPEEKSIMSFRHTCWPPTQATSCSTRPAVPAPPVAEQWGRRWKIEPRAWRWRWPDHGRALSLLPAGRFTAPRSRHPHRAECSPCNIRHGFVYERVPHITLKSIANNAEIDVIWEKWQAKLEPLREKLNAALKKTVAGVGDSARGRRQVAGR